jgi:hypothetical protein
MHKYNKSFLLLFSRGEISGYGHYKRSSLIEKYIKKNILIAHATYFIIYHLEGSVNKILLKNYYYMNR